MDGAAALWNIIKVTLLLVALVVFVPIVMRRAVRPSLGTSYRLRVVESVSCGGNRLICMVRCDERELLLGVTDAQITLLAEQTTKEEEADDVLSPVSPSFMAQLKGVWHRMGKDTP